MAIFADRVAELPRLLDALQYHPEGLRIDDLAVEVGRTPVQVREALLTYYTTDLALYDAHLVGRPPAIEFVTGAGEDDDLGRASMVRLQAPEPGRELGVAYLSVSDWPACTGRAVTGWSWSPRTRRCGRRSTSCVPVCCPASHRRCAVRSNRLPPTSRWRDASGGGSRSSTPGPGTPATESG